MNAHRMRGFTLIEMVVALAILAASLTVLYDTFETALTRVFRDSKLSEGTLLAQSLLARAGIDFPPSDAVFTGEWSEYSYTVTQKRNTSPGSQPGHENPSLQVNVIVTWLSGSGPRSIEVSTLKLVSGLKP